MLKFNHLLWSNPRENFYPQDNKESRCFTHRQRAPPTSERATPTPKYTPIETKSVSDAECMRLLKPRPVILMERFRNVACSNLEESMPTAMGSPLFCKNSNGEYGLAGIYFGIALDKGQKVALFAITGKWRSDFISKIIKGEAGHYRTLWKNPSINHRKESGSPRMNTSCIIWFYLFFLVWILLKLIN